MNPSPAMTARRIAGTLIAFLALFVVCAGVHAMPCHVADGTADAFHAPLILDLEDAAGDVADPGDEDIVTSLEDNNGSLDDTFDLPPEHTVAVSRRYAGQPAGHVPTSYAHHRGSELRPPIA